MIATPHGSADRDPPQRHVIVGISGASGSIFGIRLLEVLRQCGVIIHLVMTKAAERTIVEETDRSPGELKELAHHVHAIQNIGASIASGSFRTAGMIVAPCSIRTVGAIANCLADNLLTRAADVMLKERRRLVLMVRETPLHAGHLKVMLGAAESGAIIMPPVPAFYTRPASLDDIVNHTVGRALDLIDLDSGLVKRWSGQSQ
ncbi:MAG: UbiX family flavin prenyltransferase [Burkholderiaceae bacterium]